MNEQVRLSSSVVEFNTEYNITSCHLVGAVGVFGEGCEEAEDIIW